MTEPWRGPPVDYVPVSRLDGEASYKPTKWKQRNVLKRASIAGVTAAVALAVLFYVPYAWQTAVALAVVGGAVWGGSRIADHLNAYDGK